MSANKPVEGSQYGESSKAVHRASGYNYPDSFYAPAVPQQERTTKTDAAAQKAAEAEVERDAAAPVFDNKVVLPVKPAKSARKGKGK